MKINWTAVALLGAIGYYIWKNVSGISDKFIVGTIAAGKIRLRGSSILLQLAIPVRNNSNITVPVDAFYGNLMYGTDSISTLSIEQPITLPSWGQGVIPVEVDIPLLGVGITLFNLIKSGQYANDLMVKGLVKASGFTIPVEQKIIGLNDLWNKQNANPSFQNDTTTG